MWKKELPRMSFRKFTISIVAMATFFNMAASPVMAAAPYTVKSGFTLANPRNNTNDDTIAKFIELTKKAPKGSTIQVASYRINKIPAMQAILKAHNRGVNTQVYYDAKSDEADKLSSVLGKNVEKPSFAVKCGQGHCGVKGKMHLKMYRFSKVGQSTKIVMAGSANLAKYATSLFYGDVYTSVGNEAYYQHAGDAFEQMRTSKPVSCMVVSTDELDSWLFPCNDKDPVLLRLKTQSCAGSPLIFINMYKWSNDSRGKKILSTVKRLKRDGCRIKVMGGFMRHSIGRELDKAGIPYIDTGREEPETVSHMKMVTFGGNNPEVCTGSAHFNEGSLTGSREQVLCVKSKKWFDVLTAWNQKVWKENK